MKIYLRKSDYDSILAHAISELPDEACGLVAGTVQFEGEEEIRNIEKVYLLTNTDHSNEHFSLDPKEQLASITDMRKNNLKPLGNWHSHPESPSRSSEEDIRLSFDKNANYLILSLMDRDNPVLNSFHVENGISIKEELIIFE